MRAAKLKLPALRSDVEERRDIDQLNKLNMEKCIFGVAELTFIGEIIFAGGG